MSSSDRRRLSPAMIVALIALFVALGGTGYAALELPRNSVGSQQLKRNAVRSSKVKNRSLLAQDFKAGQLPRGPRGRTGAPAARYFASVEASGALRSGTATSVGHPGTGQYNVRFAKNVGKCSAVVTVGWNRAGQAHAGLGGADYYAAFPGYAWTPTMGLEHSDNSVGLDFRDSNRDVVDEDFHVAVFC
jgi:hypothetical protein